MYSLPMTRFIPWTSGNRNDCSANWATTTALISFNLVKTTNVWIWLRSRWLLQTLLKCISTFFSFECHDPKSEPLDHESFPITNRPWPDSLKKFLRKISNKLKKFNSQSECLKLVWLKIYATIIFKQSDWTLKIFKQSECFKTSKALFRLNFFLRSTPVVNLIKPLWS